MRFFVISSLSVLLCCLVTSCYPPYPPVNNNSSVNPAVVEATNAVVNDPAQLQLEEARRRLEAENAMHNNGGNRITGPTTGPTTAVVYPFAKKVAGKEGFIFNPYTQNQVQVEGIPSGTLIRDPHDPNPAHKFRVP